MNKVIKKNEEYIVDIIDNGYEGEGIAKINDFVVFILGAIKGEKVKILIVKVTKSHAFGKILEIIEPAKSRNNQIDCSTYKRCGGCNLRHIKYEDTLKIKKEIVQNLVNKTLKNKVIVKDTKGMENPYNYRNKAQFPVGTDKNDNPIIGVFANRTHEVIKFDNCFIQNKTSQEIAKFICKFAKEKNISAYNEKNGKGLLRHIVIKVGLKTNEIMCILVINGKEFNGEKELVKDLIERFSNIKTIVKNINTKNTNVILGKENINLYGDGYIYDKLGDYTFKISPLSFYQINPIQTEKLYNLALEGAELTGKEIVFDLYCGIGTIGIYMAKHAKKVYGIEIVEQAIEDAKENCKINNVTKAEYYAGDTQELLTELIQNKNIKPDVIVVDPPRKGLDNTTVENILKIEPKKVVYISCNPATLTRDLGKLEEKYEIKSIQPLDMFPFTSHVETIALLVKLSDSKD